MNRSRLDSIFTGILVSVALGMFGIFLYDRTGSARAVSAPRPAAEAFVEAWQEHNRFGIRLGGAEDAPMVIAEFMDFTCPFCAALAPVTDSLLQAFPQDVALYFHHFPLRGRDLSMPSAIAAECAYEQDRFQAMYRSLFSNAQSIGIWDWAEFARNAEIPDLVAFEHCISRPPEDFPRIAAGRRIGEESGVVGTPTVWVNGHVASPRSVSDFQALAEAQGITLPANP